MPSLSSAEYIEGELILSVPLDNTAEHLSYQQNEETSVYDAVNAYAVSPEGHVFVYDSAGELMLKEYAGTVLVNSFDADI